MLDFLAWVYPWTKAFHVISVITWMAGMLLFPFLLAQHVARVPAGSGGEDAFLDMERLLLRWLINPASLFTWTFGLMLVFTPGVVDWGEVWPWTKAGGLLIINWYHHVLAIRRKKILRGENTVGARAYRRMGYITLASIGIVVFSVIEKF